MHASHRLADQRYQHRIERLLGLGAEGGVVLRQHRIARERCEHRPGTAHSAGSSTAGVGSTVRSITAGSSPIVISALASARNSVNPSPNSAI